MLGDNINFIRGGTQNRYTPNIDVASGSMMKQDALSQQSSTAGYIVSVGAYSPNSDYN